MNVAALYVDALGPYPELVREWYDAERDAATYAGPWPVVAHPPCGPWGPMRHLSSGRGPEQDAMCGLDAVDAVRFWGGVLEHPRGSTLFAHCGLPRPGELPDAHGGLTFEVQQVDWGHPARKRTWLYVIPSGTGPRGAVLLPLAQCVGSRGGGLGGKSESATPTKVCSAEQRRRTPRDFAKWLVALAARAQP